jgi:general secretion pathway protein F
MTFKYLINNYTHIRFGWHKYLLKIYLINNIIKFSTLSRFTLVSSVRLTVEKGGTLNNGLAETKLFENMIIQMVRAGEDSGTLDTMIKKVAEYYKMRFDAIIDGLSEAIEPIMLLIIASMVILLALGIFLPMWDMGNAVQGR